MAAGKYCGELETGKYDSTFTFWFHLGVEKDMTRLLQNEHTTETGPPTSPLPICAAPRRNVLSRRFGAKFLPPVDQGESQHLKPECLAYQGRVNFEGLQRVPILEKSRPCLHPTDSRHAQPISWVLKLFSFSRKLQVPRRDILACG